MATILLLDQDKVTRRVLQNLFKDSEVTVVSRAQQALESASEKTPDVIICELTLAGHSGLEFIYEFRTYADWQTIPIIIYSSVWLDESLRHTRAWESLNITKYFYKPDTQLSDLNDTVAALLNAEAA